MNFICKHCRRPGSISRPSVYEKSILTSHPEKCAISSKSAAGSYRYITPPNPDTLWRRISVGLELRHRKCWLPWWQRCVNMLQGQRNFVACPDHVGVTKCEESQNNFRCTQCRGSGSISCPSDYEKSILTSCPERCAISYKSAMGFLPLHLYRYMNSNFMFTYSWVGLNLPFIALSCWS